MVESENMVGVEKGDPFSHMEELELLTEDGNQKDFRLLSFVTCESTRSSKLSGIKFILQSESDPGNIVELSPIGNMNGNCDTVLIAGG